MSTWMDSKDGRVLLEQQRADFLKTTPRKLFSSGWAVKSFLKSKGFKYNTEVKYREILDIGQFNVFVSMTSQEIKNGCFERMLPLIRSMNELLKGSNAAICTWSPVQSDRAGVTKCHCCEAEIRTSKYPKGKHFCSDECRAKATCGICGGIRRRTTLRHHETGEWMYGICGKECESRERIIRKNRLIEKRVRARVDRDLSILTDALKSRKATNDSHSRIIKTEHRR